MIRDALANGAEVYDLRGIPDTLDASDSHVGPRGSCAACNRRSVVAKVAARRKDGHALHDIAGVAAARVRGVARVDGAAGVTATGVA